MATTSSALFTGDQSSFVRDGLMALLDLCVNAAEEKVRIETILHAQKVSHADHLLDHCLISVPHHVAGFVTFGRPRLRSADFETKHLRNHSFATLIIYPNNTLRVYATHILRLYRRFVSQSSSNPRATLICLVRKNQVIPTQTFWAGTLTTTMLDTSTCTALSHGLCGAPKQSPRTTQTELPESLFNTTQ